MLSTLSSIIRAGTTELWLASTKSQRAQMTLYSDRPVRKSFRLEQIHIK